MEDKTYAQLLTERNHAKEIWRRTTGTTDHETMAKAIDYLCQCQQRLEDRENVNTEAEDSTGA
ncbi:hypothetical protein N9Q02_00985 [bacterium]|jgi:hypothetical protein|nr:hypothetical protein [bacterium]